MYIDSVYGTQSANKYQPFHLSLDWLLNANLVRILDGILVSDNDGIFDSSTMNVLIMTGIYAEDQRQIHST